MLFEGGIEKGEKLEHFNIIEGKLSLEIHEPVQEGESADVKFSIETPEGNKIFSLLDLLPPETKLNVRDSDAIEFGYKHETKMLTFNRRWFEKDPFAAFLMILHEAGHARDAIEKNELYLKPDSQVIDSELAEMERGADDQVTNILKDMKERYADHGIPEDKIKTFIRDHLLGYQVGVTFNPATREAPRFLHLQYQPDIWNDRRRILQETKEEVAAALEQKINDLYQKLSGMGNVGADQVKQAFMDSFGDLSYLDFALSRNPLLFDDLTRNLNLDEFLGGGFRTFGEYITSALLDERLGVVPFIAHEKLLAEESGKSLSL